MMIQYRYEMHSEGSTVYILTNKGWLELASFRGEKAEYSANSYIANQMRLDRLDNA